MITKMAMVGLAAFAVATWQASAADIVVFDDDCSSLSGWTTISGSPTVASSNPLRVNSTTGAVDPSGASQGAHLELDGIGTSTIQKTVNLGAGTYSFSFYYSSSSSATSFTYLYETDSSKNGWVQVTTGALTSTSAGWTHYTATFTLSSASAVSFQVQGIGSATAPGYIGSSLIDNVVLKQSNVPEPYQYGLVSLIGLFGLAAADRIRQRKLMR